MWSPQNVEAGLQAASLVRLGMALLGPALQGQRGSGAPMHLFGLAMLAFLASILDRSGVSWFQGHPLYVFRACGQAGLGQGLLALPSLATAIFIATRSWWWQHAARLFLASSFQVLLWYAWTAAAAGAAASKPGSRRGGDPDASRPPNTSASTLHAVGVAAAPIQAASLPNGAPERQDAAPQHPADDDRTPVRRRRRTIFLAAAAAGCLLTAANALLHIVQPLAPFGPQQLLPGSVFELPRDITASAWALQSALLLSTAPVLDHLALAMPRSFTPGEAAILAQALLALGAGSGAYLAGAARQGLAHVLWSPHVVQPDPGMHVPAFCMLVLFWVLLSAACSAVALAPPPPAAAPPPLPPLAAAAATSAAVRRRRTATGPEPRAKDPPAGSACASAAPQGQSRSRRPGGDLDQRMAAAVRVGAGAAAVLSLGMLVDLALWVLGRFVAASSQPRLATLAYWFACLAVAVPFMYAVSRASAARAREQQQQERAKQKTSPERGEEEEEEPGCGRDGMEPAAKCGDRRAASGGNGSTCAGNAHRPSDDLASTKTQEAAASDSGGGTCASKPAPAGMNTVPPATPQPWRQRSAGMAQAAAVFRRLGVPHIVMRKGYHLLAIVLFLPAFGWDVRMLQASLAVAGGVLVAVEAARCLAPWPALRSAIGDFMRDFADARDSGPIYVTHFTLLLGIAVPVWLGDSVCGAAAGAMMAGLYGKEAAEPLPPPPQAAAAATAAPPLSAAAARLLPSCQTILGLSGLVSLGSGDTAAACVGFLLGRRRLFARGTKKTWEGTLSGAVAMLCSWVVVVWWMDVGWALSAGTWGALAGATAGVAMLEAVTQQLDNVVVPLYYLTHLVLAMTGN
ncbi:hypothetical protein PLESTB_000562800 [Pleodorina starrii]|uniref:dolichol kinase n=1 Tax=Pleodorina starrii TaxID=330485 RepID=A0A9W6BGV6_9CHLO|nr:hypothetical protein PLESTM_000287900 [Pleodorina starrii]GLC51917.1 hypothetical protein PLESTB_000562800 [Pleodorina starrii]GLC77591.1 hypothetical protein PLESTF_001958600 [Pleodorina starrii]